MPSKARLFLSLSLSTVRPGVLEIQMIKCEYLFKFSAGPQKQKKKKKKKNKMSWGSQTSAERLSGATLFIAAPCCEHQH